MAEKYTIYPPYNNTSEQAVQAQQSYEFIEKDVDNVFFEADGTVKTVKLSEMFKNNYIDPVIIDNQFIDLKIDENYKNIVQSVYLPSDGTTEFTRNYQGTQSDLDWIWDNIQCVLLADDLTENAVIGTRANPDISGADLTGASGQVMVKIPKIYYREVLDSDGVLENIYVSKTKEEGYECHPAFLRPDLTEREFVYISRYEASDVGGKLSSISGVAPLTSASISTFRSKAEARGTGWHSYGFWNNHLEIMLFYLYYGDFNSQVKLPGYTNANSYDASYKRNTGRSDSLTSVTGSVNVDLSGTDSDLTGIVSEGNAIANSFFWIENLYGHIWKLLDGVVADGRIGERNTLFTTNDPTKFSSVEADILADYTDMEIDLPAIIDTGYIKTLQKGLLPQEFGGNSSTYVTDYFYSYLDDETRDYFRVLRAGAPLSNGSTAGVSVLDTSGSPDIVFSSSGSRLCACN